jgi:phage RecT family recombinase
MSDGRQVATQLSAREVETMPLGQLLDVYQDQFAKVLPEYIKPQQFARVVLTAISEHPELNGADRRTLLNSCIKCANDGLLPDGRDAALVVFNTKQKNPVTNKESWIKAVQYLPMVAGIRRRMWNSGDVLEAFAAPVYRGDKFRYSLGDNAFIEHEPPSDLTVDRGDLVGAYAIIRLKSGQVLRDVMRRDEIEKRRNQSKAKNSLMWKDFYEEGACKTVLRHCAKSAPQASVSMQLLERMLDRDEEEELPQLEGSERAALPRPTLVELEQAQATGGALWIVIDLEGEEHEHPTPKMAADHLLECISLATKRDNPRNVLQIFAENNRDTIDQLLREERPLADECLKAYREAIDSLDPLRNVGNPPPAENKPRQTRREAKAAQQQPPAEQRASGQQAPAGERLGLGIPPAEVVDHDPIGVGADAQAGRDAPKAAEPGMQLPTEPKDPTMPRLKFREDDGSPRWTQWSGDLIVQLREADKPRLEELFAFARSAEKRMPAGVWRDIERAYGERLQSLSWSSGKLA